MRTFPLGLGIAAFAGATAAGAFGCSLFLDTDSLRGGAGGATGVAGTSAAAGQAGAGGNVPDASDDGPAIDGGDATPPDQDAAEVEPPRPCILDMSCDDGNPCTVDRCDIAAVPPVCKPSQPYHGPVLKPLYPTPQPLAGADKEAWGVPTLLALGEEVYLAAWWSDAGQSDVLVKRIPADNAFVTEASLRSELGSIGGVQYAFASSPGMIAAKGTVDRIYLLVAAGENGGKPSVHLFDLSVPKLQKPVVSTLPRNLGPTGYDAKPERAAPAFFEMGADDMSMWVHGDGIYYAVKALTGSGTATFAPVSPTPRAFVPIRGPGLPGAVFGALVQVGAVEGEERTMLWVAKKPPVLTPISEDGPLGPRLGVAATAALESGGAAVSLIEWSFPKAGNPMPGLKQMLASCDSTSCALSAFSQGSPELFSPIVAFTSPALASARMEGQNDKVELTSIAAFSMKDEPKNQWVSLLALGGYRLSVSGSAVTDYVQLNPETIPVAVAYSAGTTAAANLPRILGQVSTVVSSKGRRTVAWVQRDHPGGKAKAFWQQYKVDAAACP
jgi:hypothetical protein